MRFRGIYLLISLAGLGLLIVVTTIVTLLGSNALAVLYIAYDWVALCTVVGLLAMGFSAVRQVVRHFAKPS
jgi:TRAP-type C4-dicarboxylate transport system permease small subunit